MADTVDRRVVEIDVRTARNMQAEVKRAADSLGGLEKTFGSLKGIIAEFGAGLVAGLSTGAFIGAIRESLNAMDEMGKRAQQIGLSTEALSALTFQAELAGVAATDLDSSLVKLNSGLTDLGVESTSATKALERLGVVAGTDTGAALEQIAEQFSTMADGPAKTALAVDLFGRSGAKLIPMLNEGAAGIEKFRREAERLGIVISKDAAAAAEVFNDNIATLQAGIKGTVLQLTQGLVPALTQITNSFEGSTESGDRFKSLGEGIGIVAKFIASIFHGLAGAIQIAGRGIAAFTASWDALVRGRFRDVGVILEEWKADVASISADTASSIAKLDAAVAAPAARVRTGVAPGVTTKAATEDLKAQKKALDETTAAWVAMAEAVLASDPAQQKLIENLQRVDELTGRAAARRLAADVELLEQAFKAGRISVDEFMVAMQKVHGITEKVEDTTTATADAFLEMGKAIQQSVEGWSGAAADAILDFATGAEQDIEKMVEGILRQFAKMALQKLIFDRMFAAAGAAVGGVFTPARAANGAVFDQGGPVHAFAGGGVVSGATPFAFAGGVGVMGEAGPEAIMPLQRNAQGQLGVAGGDVTVNVINQAGAQVGVESSKGANGEREVTVLVQRAVADGFARGRFDSVMGATYGLNRRGH
jgi:hypothetical protein